MILKVSNIEKGKNDDPVLKYVPKSEFKTLDVGDRNQLALDRFLKSKKTNWEIGRDYERYIGYIYETKGYEVSYFGIFEGLEDLGRDLICSKNGKVSIVQCKCWSKNKVIHEKHINQLYGTTIKYLISNQNYPINSKVNLFQSLKVNYNITPVFITSTILSKTAREFAKALDVEIHEEEKLIRYPIIKCNISKSTGERIYHLPFDQQYDKIKINNNKGSFYVSTVKEAESKGFRRAYKWRGKNGK